MKSDLSRRGFLTAAASAPVAALAGGSAMAMTPIERAGDPRLKLSLVAYSMRQYLTADDGADGAMDLHGFVDWAAELGFGGVELTSYYFPESPDAGYLRNLKRHCHVQGMPIAGGGIRNNLCHDPDSEATAQELAHIETWAARYETLGAAPMRIFAGTPDGDASEEETVANIIANLETVCAIGAAHGVIMALENHGYLRDPDRLGRVIEATDSPWFGLTLDSDNFDVDDPYAAFERFAPYAVNVHIKEMVTPVGQDSEPADLARQLRALADVGYRGYVGLEYEEAEDPYEAIPRLLGALRGALPQ